MIRLREINCDNFEKIIDLSVSEEQKEFVAPNVYSLAQAKAQPECNPLAVYNDDVPVGFVMYCIDSDDHEYWIYRVMIDKAHQHKGFGKMAMQSLLTLIMQDKEHEKVYISFEPENIAAKKLYEGFGFIPDGRFVGNEIVYRLNYGKM